MTRLIDRATPAPRTPRPSPLSLALRELVAAANIEGKQARSKATLLGMFAHRIDAGEAMTPLDIQNLQGAMHDLERAIRRTENAMTTVEVVLKGRRVAPAK